MYRIIEKLNYKDFKEKYFNNNYFIGYVTVNKKQYTLYFGENIYIEDLEILVDTNFKEIEKVIKDLISKGFRHKESKLDCQIEAGIESLKYMLYNRQ